MTPSAATSSTHASPQPGHGSVTLVGAGPGDPGLLTLNAVKAISDATVLLVDDLVGADILAHAAPEARVVRVGKRGGCRSTPQAFIDRLMVRYARQGHRVVRLKGGDPFVFGRGGEEVEQLRARGIDVQVVNGITSGLAAVTSLGVGLTHRTHAHGVIFVTGHSRQGADGPDWRALARSARDARLTLVIYMGLRGIAAIQQALLSELPGTMPAAVVERASLPDERMVVTTLLDLPDSIAAGGFASPCIIIVGDVLLGATAVRREDGLKRSA